MEPTSPAPMIAMLVLRRWGGGPDILAVVLVVKFAVWVFVWWGRSGGVRKVRVVGCLDNYVKVKGKVKGKSQVTRQVGFYD